MDKYQNKYRIASARAQWWDYGWNGAYFITICTQNREHFFGEIRNGKMTLSQVGVIADILWHDIPNHTKFVELGDYVVMPNHIHGILILDRPEGGNMNGNGIGNGIGIGNVETLHATSLPEQSEQSEQSEQPEQPERNKRMAQISPTPGSVSTIIRSYKSAVTKHANRLGLDHGWQPRFHDHIIRYDAEYQRISDYILNNPAKWQEDKFYSV